MKKIHIIWAGIAVLLAIIVTLQAQETAIPVHPIFIHAPVSSSEDDLATMIEAIELTTPQAADSAPTSGTFWSAQNPNFPPFPGNLNNTPVWNLGDGIWLLDDRDIDYTARTPLFSRGGGGGVHAMDEGPPSPGDGDGGDGTNTFYGSPTPAVDYGTNLWIAQVAVVSNNFVGIGTNTLADIQYEIQSRTNLLETNWESEGFILGSELTNWTPLSVAENGRTNLFLRLRSWADDGSGLPIWWQLQYFGYIGVDPYADPDGDGWNNLQEFQNGTDPTVFNTPPTPQGLTAALNQPADTAAISWLPSPGAVAGYTLEKTDDNPYPETVQDFSISVPSTSYEDDLSGDTTNPFYGNNYLVSYRIKANYTNGDSSAWSASIPLQQPTVSVTIAPGANGTTYLAVSGVPVNAATVRLVFDDYNALENGDTSFDYSEDIPVSSITNGLYQLPSSWQPPDTDAYGYAEYSIVAESVDTNNDASGIAYLDAEDGGWPAPPFYDGRVQMKQNLIFQFRVANSANPFEFVCFDGPYSTTPRTFVINPANYAYAGFYDINNYNQIYGNPNDWPSLNTYLPFEDNALYQNFVFNSSNADTNGNMTTGVQYPPGSPPPGDYLALLLPPTYLPSDSSTNILSGLGTNETRWLCSYPLILSSVGYYTWAGYEDFIGRIGFQAVFGTTTLTFNNSVSNYWGLPFLSAKFFYTDTNGNPGSTIFNTGDSISQVSPGAVYMEAAQPEFQTVEYDFWNGTRTNIPGSHEFSTTNQSDLMIVGVQNEIGITAYAKLAITNGYSGAYGYLGQYLDKAYKMDDSGNVTTNTTGVVSPYGTFFATDAGAAVLVTMPDPDTGERGTCTVYCVSLQLDANHDGNMDLSFNGADATSQANPMEFWINNDNDGTGIGQDIYAPSKPDSANNTIQSMRDLEDFARLWICGMPALTNDYQVTLSWANISSGNPSIKIFPSREADGGTEYLTDTNLAQNYVGNPLTEPCFGMVTNGQNFQFPDLYFTTSGNKYLMFEGVTAGSGELVLTITDANGNQIAQTGVWLDLHDIKDFYEQAVVTENMTGAKSNWTSSVETVLPAVSALGADTNLIVLVHGINMRAWDCVNDAETVCKRLYWAGYQGKFAEVQWPCNLLTPIPSPLSPAVFNDSELQGYKASTAFADYIEQLRARFPSYRLNILAHSQGNAVVSEAIKNGLSVDTYILTQGALPDSTYDINAPTNAAMASYDTGSNITPDLQPMGYHGVYTNTNFSGKIVNFYNSQDGVLDDWVTDQKLLKPSVYFSGSIYSYDGTNSYFEPLFGSDYLVTDPEESRAEVARSRTLPIGQSGPASAHGVIKAAVDLNAQYGFNSDIAEHSAQWTRPIQASYLYYTEVLLQIQP